MRFWLTALLAVCVLLPGWTAELSEYRFAPGDLLEITVTPQQGLDRTVPVQPDGQISYPLAGVVMAAGLTVGQLAEKLRGELDRHLVNPQVTVTLKELHKQAVTRVSVLGAVRNPAVFEMRDGATVAEMLAAAGGPTSSADLRRVMIQHADHSTLTADLGTGQPNGALDRNVALQAGDVIVVPEGPPPTALVLGEVVKPGSIELRGESRLLDAISLAGGPTPQADMRHIMLARAGVRGARTLDLKPLLAGSEVNGANMNLVLQPGDTIVIPQTEERIYVLGRVAKPGIYPIKADDRVLDALAMAGGPTFDGDVTTAFLVRRDAEGQSVAKPLDLKKMLGTAPRHAGELAENTTLRPGDVLFVPDKKQRHTASEIAGLIWPLTSLLNVLR